MTRSKTILARISAGRRGRPEETAGAAVVLWSPAADQVQGAVLTVEGGCLAR